MATARRAGQHGPAYAFFLKAQRALDDLEISIREISEIADVSLTTFYRLETAPHRDRKTRRAVVLRLAEALNKRAAEKGVAAPFPDRDEVLRLAGLAVSDVDETISVRDAVLHSGEYDKAQKTALLALLDLLDRDRQRDVPAGRSDETA